MWTTSSSKHKVTSGTKSKRRKSFPPMKGLEQQDSKSLKRGYQKVSCDWTEDPRRSRSPHDLTHFGQKHGFVCQRKNRGSRCTLEWRKRPVGKSLCERSVATAGKVSTNVIVETRGRFLGSCQPRTETREEILV